MRRMKQVFAEKIGGVVARDVPVPNPGVGEVRVATIYAGICGSDTHGVAGSHAFLFPPYVPGHEAVGVVDTVGQGVDSQLVGKRVILKPNIKCGRCVPCSEDRSNACQSLQWIGCDPSGTHPGAMAEYFLAPAEYVLPIDDQITDEQAALIECFATPIHAARIAGDLAGKNVVIIGAGTIGVLQLIAADLAGAARVVVTDLEPSKRERAVSLGAKGAVDGSAVDVAEQVTGTLGGPADVIFDCVTNASSASLWTKIIRHGGTVCIVGVPAGGYEIPVDYVQDWELRIQGCANYNESDILKAISEAAQIPADQIVSAIFPLEEGPAAFAEASQSSSGKVLVRGCSAV